MEILINSLEELKDFAKRLSKCLKGNEVILLKGNLAAGKTTFTRFLVSHIDEEAGEEVNSPTFTIMNQYETKKFPVFHIDLYRVKDFDFTDFIGEGLIIVEWAEEKLFNIESVPVILIDIEIKEENKRIFRIKYKNAEYIKECLEYQ